MRSPIIKPTACGICLPILALPLLAETGFPKDVEKFIAKREICEHFRGEIPAPGDKQRVKKWNEEVGKRCKGTDRSLAQLARKYAADPRVINQLGKFEPNIEAARTPR